MKKTNILLKTSIHATFEVADQKEFLELSLAAGKTRFWALLNVPARRTGLDWPQYSREAAEAVGADLP